MLSGFLIFFESCFFEFSGLMSGSPFGKKWTPAITVPQIREGLAMILHQACDCANPDRIVHERKRRLIRNELARFYHWMKRNLLAPLRLQS